MLQLLQKNESREELDFSRRKNNSIDYWIWEYFWNMYDEGFAILIDCKLSYCAIDRWEKKGKKKELGLFEQNPCLTNFHTGKLSLQ